MKLGQGDVIVIASFLLVLNVMFMWCIDVSITGIAEQVKTDVMDTYEINYKSLDGYGQTNGVFNVSPTLMYHICLWSMILTNFFMFIIIVHERTKGN